MFLLVDEKLLEAFKKLYNDYFGHFPCYRLKVDLLFIYPDFSFSSFCKARFDVMSKYEVDDPLKDISSTSLYMNNEEEPTIQFEGASETTLYELFMLDFENYQYLEIYNSG